MQLLKIGAERKFSLESFSEEEAPPFAILSHTWSRNPAAEVKLEDIKDGTCNSKPAFHKIQFCGQQAMRDGLQYLWVDTCCIDQTNLAELTKAINCMYRWYEQAARCYVYLEDVKAGSQDAES